MKCRETRPSSKVCIVLNPRRLARHSYYIYILDLRENLNQGRFRSPLVERNATIQLVSERLVKVVCAVANSTLYMFGVWEPSCDWRSISCSYDLSSLWHRTGDDDEEPIDINLDSDVEDGTDAVAPMSHEKNLPRAALVGKRIWVFSTDLLPGKRNFEAYNPRTNKWSSIPETPVEYADGEYHCEVKFFCVENSCFILSTIGKGSYCLDFGRPRKERNWERTDNVPKHYSEGSSCQPVLKDGNSFSSASFNVYDIGPAMSRRYFGSFRDLEEGELRTRGGRGIGRVRNEGKERLRGCVVETGGFAYSVFEFPDRPVLRLSVFDVEDGDDDDPDQCRPIIVGSRAFYIHSSITSHVVRVEGIFTV